MRTSLPGLDALAEERILEAIRRGDFDDLPGAGKPLSLDDDLLVPIEARVANRVLKNAGLVPVEVHQRRELALLESAIPKIVDAGDRARALAKLAVLRERLGGARAGRLLAERQYSRRIVERLAGL